MASVGEPQRTLTAVAGGAPQPRLANTLNNMIVDRLDRCPARANQWPQESCLIYKRDFTLDNTWNVASPDGGTNC